MGQINEEIKKNNVSVVLRLRGDANKEVLSINGQKLKEEKLDIKASEKFAKNLASKEVIPQEVIRLC